MSSSVKITASTVPAGTNRSRLAESIADNSGAVDGVERGCDGSLMTPLHRERRAVDAEMREAPLQ